MRFNIPAFTASKTACAVLLGSCLLAPALALPLGQGDIQRLVAEGKLVPALKAIDEALVKTPKDPQLQFQRGVVMSMQGRRPEALEAFKKLVAENPNMAPAYNNMAVIYAAMSDYDAAKTALDKAIRISPDYATAYQNLGDVYVQFATQAYQKSMQIDKSDPTVMPKVMLLREALNQSGDKPTTATAAAAAAPAPAPAPAKTAPPAPMGPATAVAAAPAPAPTKAADSTASADVTAAVRSWAAAWSARDAAAYVAAYAPDFTGNAKSHAAWQAERTERITKRSSIKVEVSDMVVSVIGDKAQVRFRQSYESDGPKENSRKSLTLVRSPGGAWLITKEAAGS